MTVSLLSLPEIDVVLAPTRGAGGADCVPNWRIAVRGPGRGVILVGAGTPWVLPARVAD